MLSAIPSTAPEPAPITYKIAVVLQGIRVFFLEYRVVLPGFRARFYYRRESSPVGKPYQPVFDNDPDFEKLAKEGREA